MSCFICRPETFTAVEKMLFQFDVMTGRNPDEISIEIMNKELENIASTNCTAYAERYAHHYPYGADIEAEFEPFNNYPLDELTMQELYSSLCYLYQVEELSGIEKTSFYRRINNAIEFFKKRNGWSFEIMSKVCKWE